MEAQGKSGINLPKEKINFQGRIARLDWKRIASIDIDNLVQEGDISQLLELISPVTFCKADSEFDHGKIDPSFIKVFRLSQLISEYLLASQEKCAERLSSLQEKYDETEKEKGKLSEENLHLKESLSSAKKELRRRKEMIASTQSEILGQNNGDEYDQCPYCTKKFLSRGYLLAHIQRRHQGLPLINPLREEQKRREIEELKNSLQASVQDEIRSLNSRLESQERFWEEKLTAVQESHEKQIQQLRQELQSQTTNNNVSINKPIYSLEDVTRPVRSIPQYEDTIASEQCNLEHEDSERGDEESEGLLRKSDFSLRKRPGAKGDSKVVCGSNVEVEIRERGESSGIVPVPKSGEGKRIEESEDDNQTAKQSQRNVAREEGEVVKSTTSLVDTQSQIPSGEEQRRREIEELKNAFQTAVQDEIKSLISRLENQEQFWKDKLASVEESHEKQIQQLRQELQSQTKVVPTNKPIYSSEDVSKTARPLQQNADEMGSEQFQLEREDSDGDEENEDESGAYPSRVIMVGPKGPLKPDFLHRQQQQQQLSQEAMMKIGAQRDKVVRGFSDDVEIKEQGVSSGAEAAAVPVAKPRESKRRGGNEPRSAGLSSGKGTAVATGETEEQLQSLSESEPEYLTVIQPEEFQEARHDNSIFPKKIGAAGKNTAAAAAVVAGNNTNSHRQKRDLYHQLSSTTTSKPGVCRRGKEAEDVTGARVKSDDEVDVGAGDVNDEDEVSDYTLSDSMLGLDDEEDEQNDNDGFLRSNVSFQKRKKNDTEFIDHPRGKSSVRQTPVKEKKRIIFDAQARKLVEASSDNEDDDDDEDDDHSGKNDDLNNSTSADDEEDADDEHGGGGNGKRRKKKSQMDLVRAKTMMELEQGMTDIGLNPESTAIGLEEMGRALKHLKLQRRASTDQIHDYDKFEEERNAVKTYAKFEATKSSIDGKLEAISTLNAKKSEKSSFMKIFSVVKTSGQKFKKRVKSAVKKKPVSEPASEEEDSEGEKKGKGKSSSAPVPKSTFFSKARWSRKKRNNDGGGGDGDADKVSMSSKRSADGGAKLNETEEIWDDVDEEEEDEDEEEDDDVDEVENEESSESSQNDSGKEDEVQRVSSATPNLSAEKEAVSTKGGQIEVKRWDDGESDERLEEIKRIVDKSKRDFGSEDDEKEEANGEEENSFDIDDEEDDTQFEMKSRENVIKDKAKAKAK